MNSASFILVIVGLPTSYLAYRGLAGGLAQLRQRNLRQRARARHR